MREILFRGKNVKTKEWVYGYYELCAWLPGTDKEEVYPVIHEYHGDAYRVIPESVGEYAGLTDKNGVKIFEGDIVQLDDKEYSTNIGIVGFEEGLFIIAKSKRDEDKFAIHQHCKVIGNTHG